MKQERYTIYKNGALKVLKNNIQEIIPFIKAGKRFVVADIDGDHNQQHTVKLLKQNGAVEKVDTEKQHTEHGWKEYTVWQWKERVRKDLQEYIEDCDQFPRCGERVSIHNPRDTEGLACPNCGTEWAKERVKEWL